MRLITLNKEHPKIPKPKQFRPIMIQTHFVKFIECRMPDRFSNYCYNNLLPMQTGFIRSMGTQINLLALYMRLRGRSLRKTCLFVDLSNAYNSVFRKKLYSILKKLFKMLSLIYFGFMTICIYMTAEFLRKRCVLEMVYIKDPYLVHYLLIYT